MVRFAGALATALALAVLAGPSPAWAEDGAKAVVAEFQSGLLATMKNAKALGIRGRADRLRPVIEKAFNLPVMVATAIAPHWQKAAPDQKTALLAAFGRMSVATAATLFDDYSGESFKVVGERKGAGPTLLVDTQIVRPNKSPVDITYVAANIRGRWWMIDIIVGGGISEITVRRSEYLALLNEGGVQRLVAALDRKVDNLLSGKEKGGPAGGGP